MDVKNITFVIPALNEEKNISDTINSIKSAVKQLNYEILVIDNGSIDNTIKIVKSLGASTLEYPDVTIAELRNMGVKNSSGDLICFIDSDVSVGDSWENELQIFLRSLKNSNLFVTGSRCEIDSNNETFVEKNWFQLLQSSKNNYINSGHMITTRGTFDQIGGFDAALKTGEDYDFCKRADSLDIPIIENKKLRAFHRGYPKTIEQFFLREAWHGRSDIESTNNFLKSRTAQISLVNSIALLFFLLGISFGQNEIAVLGFTSALLINVLITAYKFGSMPVTQFLKVAFCFEIYLLGRTYSLFYKRKRPAARE
jgi:glycosyltransferase involved in cell wall biosynthesis